MKVYLLAFGILVLPMAFGQEVRRAEPATADWALLDARAKFLAGVPLPATSPLAAAQGDAFYQKHAAMFEKMWARFNEFYFSPMLEWSAQELSPRINLALPLVYFFGGPDLLHAMAFYPTAPDILLGGLESVGSLPEPENLDPAAQAIAFTKLREATSVILSYGYFITKDMKEDLVATDFQGVLPVMLTFLAMSGAEVMAVQFFAVLPDGSTQETGTAAGTLPGVRILYRRSPVEAPQRVHYVQANVANDSLASHSGVLLWAARFGAANAYQKSASYLLHEPSFSKVRAAILTQSHSVLQDDSGIPLKEFLNGEWRCFFFGTYSGTLDIFKSYYQSDLQSAFAAGAQSLPFGTGYKWRTGESNLLLAIRQAPPRAEPVIVPQPESNPQPSQ